MLLSLDLSTTCCGYSMFTNNELMYADYIDLNQAVKNNISLSDDRKDFDFLIQKADAVIKVLHQKIVVGNYDLQDIVVEAPLMASNNQKTTILLAKFNSIVSYKLYEEFAIIPHHISITDWRKYAFPDVHRKRGDDVKKIYADAILKLYPDIQLEYNKRGNIDKRMYDMLDSIGIGLGWINRK